MTPKNSCRKRNALSIVSVHLYYLKPAFFYTDLPSYTQIYHFTYSNIQRTLTISSIVQPLLPSETKIVHSAHAGVLGQLNSNFLSHSQDPLLISILFLGFM